MYGSYGRLAGTGNNEQDFQDYNAAENNGWTYHCTAIMKIAQCHYNDNVY